ncbi:hypothetical protein D3C81_1910850 [compost metagenome]
MRIQAEANGALGEAGGVLRHHAMRPLLTVTVALGNRLEAVAARRVEGAVTQIAVKVEVPIEHIQTTVFDEALGVSLIGLSGAGSDGNGAQQGKRREIERKFFHGVPFLLLEPGQVT